ncbi:T9SS type A sorting domain-containing protein [Corallibacter sp.]|uniref:T9SS type A sorting domain-containing protein n=1 Tax=Corallibacter sp. TaxID=2038084 RepID=UPI003AB12D6A
MKKNYIILLIAFLCLTITGFGQTYNQITSLAELTDGNYIIAESNEEYAMNNSHNGTYLARTAISPVGGTITNPDATIIWTIETNGSGKTIYSEDSSRYISYSGSSNNVQIVNTVTSNNQRWNITYSGGNFIFSNIAITNRDLQYNPSAPRFACYTGSQIDLVLYKQDTPSGPTITATPSTITGLDYSFGNGPSTPQSFDIEGTLLTAGIDITAPTNFEIATSAAGPYNNTVNIPAFDANNTNTIYVRLVSGLAQTSYSGTITMTNATSGLSSTPTIDVSGDVTPPPPVNNDCSGAISLTPNASCTYQTYSNVGATDSGISNPSCSSLGPDVWFSVVVPASGEITVETSQNGSISDTGVSIYTGTCGSLTEEVCNDDGGSGNMSLATAPGLTVGSTVYIRVWEYGGGTEGDFDICVTTPTPCTAPTNQPTNLTLSNITNSSIDGSFSTTTADEYLVVVSTSSTLGANPVNGTTYSAGDTIGSGTVVQSSNATTFTATGLSQTTQYYFFVFAFNDSSCAGGPNYNTSTPLTDDEKTVSGPCFSINGRDFPTTGGYTINSGASAKRLASGSSFGSISTNALTGISGDLTVQFTAEGWDSNENEVTVTLNGVSQFFNTIIDGSYNTYTATFTSVPDNSILEFSTISGMRVFIDLVEIYCAPSCTPAADPVGTISGATPVCAASTSLSFSGTAPANVAYYWQSISLGEDQTNNASNNLTVTASGDYYVRAFNTVEGCWSDGEIGPYAVSVTTSTTTIDSHPSDTSTGVGGSAAFVVDSPSASNYQWQVSTDGGSTWTNIGTDNNSLSLNNIQLTDNGNLYQVIVSNSCGNTTSNTATLTVTTSTIFNPGELIFVGYDGQINGSGSEDEFLIATLVDITAGTEFSIVNSRFEAGAAANVRTNKWGGGSDSADQQPFEAKITYTGSAIIPAGSVLRFEITNSNAFIVNASVTEGTTTTTRTTDFSANVITPGSYPNISTSSDDQLYLMQGDFVSDGTINPDEANYYFTGTLLHGITIGIPWVDLTSACNGDDSGNNRESRLPPELRCFNVESTSSIRGYYENDKEHGLATIREIVNNVSDVAGNWDLGSYNFDPTDNTANSGGKTFLLNPSNPAGQWVGDVDTNWFNCANWEGLAVPKSSTDVKIDNSASNNAVIDYTANYSDEFNDIAYSHNLTISGSRVEISDNINNLLEVHGNLLIESSGTLDMDDGNNATSDGQIHLYGDWINNRGTNAFLEGNSTIVFTGNTSQNVVNGATPIPPITTEEFYNVILNNDYNTGTSNDLHMHGNLTINTGKTLTVTSGRYTYVNLGVTNNGTFNIENNGSLVQGDDTGINTGNISMLRSASVRNYDYVYWSSPVTGYGVNNISSTAHIYRWNPTISNPNGGQGNWVSAVGETMIPGVGYIVRGANGQPEPANSSDLNFTATFNNGVPLNGVINVSVSRGTDPSNDDDDWNLVGNPYPSAIDAYTFLTNATNSTVLDGFVNIWTHGTLPSNAIADPFYDDFSANYTASDYIAYNALGSGAGPGDTTIGAGQSFMVNMIDGTASTQTIEFRNNMRDKSYDNSVFYRSSNQQTEDNTNGRFWLDLVSNSTQATNRILLGYTNGATHERDRMFDALTVLKEEQSFYSVIENKPFVIQGRGLPFDVTDRIPLGIKTVDNDNYTIAIAEIDGFFETENQTIYLKDYSLNITHNLLEQPYSFTADAGEINDRFEIVFTDTLLSIDENTINDNGLTIIDNNGDTTFKVNAAYQIKRITLIDMLGREVFSATGNSNNETYNLSHLSQANYIAKVQLDNDYVITKKMVKK